jgi:nitrite reductase/ring-hydroxylating ferredoxin subunit
VQCPWHGSQFDVCTGEVTAGPARKKIAVYETAMRGKNVTLVTPDAQD